MVFYNGNCSGTVRGLYGDCTGTVCGTEHVRKRAMAALVLQGAARPDLAYLPRCALAAALLRHFPHASLVSFASAMPVRSACLQVWFSGPDLTECEGRERRSTRMCVDSLLAFLALFILCQMMLNINACVLIACLPFSLYSSFAKGCLT